MMPSLVVLFNWVQIATALKILSYNNISTEERFVATLKNPPQLTSSSLTMCIWTKPITFSYNQFFGVFRDKTKLYLEDFSNDGRSLYLRICETCNAYSISLADRQRILPYSWVLICLQIDVSNNLVRLYLNSELIFEKYDKENMAHLNLKDNFLSFGLRIINAGANRTGLQVWSTILSEENIEAMYECDKSYPKPDVLNWNDVEFDVKPKTNKIILSTVPEEDGPCSRNKEELFFFADSATMTKKREAVRMCDAIGGSMHISDAFKAKVKLFPEAWIWVPAFREQGIWRDIDGTQIEDVFWDDTAETLECAAYTGGAYTSLKCSEAAQFFCLTPRYSLFKFKGLCSLKKNGVDVYVDSEYIFTPELLVDSYPTWIGVSATLIRWNMNKTYWELCSRWDTDCYATATGLVGLPSGVIQWNLLSGVFCKDDELKEGLVLSQCKEGEFTCNDGTCINITDKCNIVEDCQDSSDENYCGILKINNYESYSPYFPDITVDADKKIVGAMVNVSINVIEVIEIKEKKMKYSVKFNLNLKWFDSRLTWKDLHEKKSVNILNPSEISSIWLPRLIFKNTEKELETRIDNSTLITVERLTDFMLDPFAAHETAHFRGSGNPLSLSRIYTMDFLCRFQLQKYPFDTQTCKIVLSSVEKDLDFLNLGPSNITYSGPQNMMTYTVMKYNIKRQGKLIVVTFKFKRIVSRHILSTFLPSVCILIIAQVLQPYKVNF